MATLSKLEMTEPLADIHSGPARKFDETLGHLSSFDTPDGIILDSVATILDEYEEAKGTKNWTAEEWAKAADAALKTIRTLVPHRNDPPVELAPDHKIAYT